MIYSSVLKKDAVDSSKILVSTNLHDSTSQQTLILHNIQFSELSTVAGKVIFRDTDRVSDMLRMVQVSASYTLSLIFETQFSVY